MHDRVAIMMKFMWVFSVLVLSSQIFGQLVTDPLPYAAIANPLPDTMNQLYRDSVNLKFSPIRINQAGYRPQDDKYFYYVASSGTPSGFKVIDNTTGTTVGTGTLTSTSFKSSGQLHIKASNNAQIVGGGDTRYTMDSKVFAGSLYLGQLPALSPGTFRIVVGSDTSAKFVVDEKLYSWVKDALLKFYGVNRCGNDNSWFHKDCHLQDAVVGGWHDCGDHLKEGITMGYTAAVLGLCAAVFQDRDHDVYAANQGITRVTDGIPDILYEAKHGADFILSSYNKAGGEVSKMVTSVGDFGNDHNCWGRPENQDKMPTVRGGPVRAARVELGANILGEYAANLAFVSKVIRRYDGAYADKCLKAAKDLYAYAKAHKDVASSSPAYSGNSVTNDKLAFAAMALTYATADKAYLNDLCFDKTIGTKYNSAFPKFSYEGGWFALTPDFNHAGANTDWASVHIYASWGFFRLVLMDEALCTTLGLTDSQRKALIEKTIYSAEMDLGNVGNTGDLTISLPSNSGWVPSDIKVESPWMTMHTQMEWVWNRYQAGNITEMYIYYDMASKVQGMELPNTPASTNWKADEIKKILIRQLDYMLGVNPWDISMIYGVGNKNFNHPHHRAANPEGKNVPGAFYPYIPPVGALQGSYKPTTTTNLYSEFWGEYQHSETGIDGTTAIFLPVAGLAKEEPLTNPSGTVSITYVGCDKAIIDVHQSRYGNAEIHYGTDGNTSQVKKSDSADVVHEFELTGLKNGTVYSFYVKVSDLFDRDSTIKDIDEEKKAIDFEFKTLANCPKNADIAKVKVCGVTSDSAEIFWYTPNGEFDSKVVYGDSKPPKTVDAVDESGHPTKLHYVKIGGLKEKTTYYFYVQSGESIDDNNGAYYQFTTPVEHVNFDIRTVRYTWDGMPSMGLGIINQDVKSYDSLDVRLYFRAEEGFEKDLAARLDIAIRYREDGFQDSVTGDLKTQILKNLYTQKPTKMEDTYNEKDHTYAYYFSIPLWGLEMRSQARIRIDLVFDTWEQERLKDHLNEPPKHIINDADWSFGPHSVANGDPIDFPGVPIVKNKDDIDNNYWNLPINNYICVYRKGEFVWGYSPSSTEMETKKTYYTVESHITSPVNNPTQTDTVITQVAKAIAIRGWAKVSPVDGKVNDIWVNGVPVSNLSSCLSWNASQQRYDYSIPASITGEFNEFDVTVFAGPDETCTECYGCANYNHHFNLKYIGSKPHPSTLTLKDMTMQVIPNNDTAHIDTTKFYVLVKDLNGNQHGKSVDTVFATIKNPALGDSTIVPLIETGDSTGEFQTSYAVSVVDKTADQTGAAEIAMTGGDKIWITYVDPTDQTDISEATLVSKADFPVANSGAIFDSNGDGAIDRMVINYSIPLKNTPDSASFGFPVSTDIHVLRSGPDNFKVNGNSLEITFTTPLDKGVTGFASGTKSTAKSFLTNQNSTKASVFTLYDSIGPIITSPVTLLEKTGSGDDTLTVTFSEIINIDVNVDSVLMVRHNGNSYGVTVLGIIEQNSRTMKLLVRSKGVALQADDSLYINSSGTITDAAKNHAHKNNPRQPLVLKEAAPKVISAFYTADKDGFLDKVEITFAKKVNPDDISFGFKWNNGARIPVTNSNVSQLGSDSTRVLVRIKGLITGSQIVTSGKMELSAIHSNFSKDTLRSDVIDNAAPVITGALLAPSPVKNGNYYADTLTVTFSEPVENVKSEQPFNFKSMPNKTLYSMKMENSYKGDATKQIFIISSYIDIEFPGTADSIRIDVNGKVSDKNGNVQKVVENHYVLMTAKSIPFSVTMKSGPNPFTPGIEPVDNPDFDGALKSAHENKGLLIVLSPDTSRIKRQVSINGSIKIFDSFGSTIRKEDFKSNTAKTMVFFFWDGRNSSGRLVGSGTYVANITVQNENGQVEKKKLLVGVKR
jgi:hypothetical protein